MHVYLIQLWYFVIRLFIISLLFVTVGIGIHASGSSPVRHFGNKTGTSKILTSPAHLCKDVIM